MPSVGTSVMVALLSVVVFLLLKPSFIAHSGLAISVNPETGKPGLVPADTPVPVWSDFTATASPAAPLRVLVLIPDFGFDPSEAAAPWLTLKRRGHSVTFATETGSGPSGGDPHAIEGFVAGTLMAAKPECRDAYDQMVEDEGFKNPIAWSDVNLDEFDGLLLPGGHSPTMKPYLNSPVVHSLVKDWMTANRATGAICHGVLTVTAALTADGQPMPVHTTTVPMFMERLAYLLTGLLGMGFGDEYQLSTTWPSYTEELVSAASQSKFISGPHDLLGAVWHGTRDSHSHAFTVKDGHYVSARFPGDVWLFSVMFTQTVEDLAGK